MQKKTVSEPPAAVSTTPDGRQVRAFAPPANSPLQFLKLTDEIEARLAIVMGARALGDVSVLNQVKGELADELLNAIAIQSARLARLPPRARGVVDIGLTPKRRARRA
jgi:hypothetical protein